MSWGVGRIALALYPLGAGAMAVNAYFASLLGHWIGLPVLTPAKSIVVGSIVAVPLTLLFARHVRRMIDEAEGR